MGGRERPRGVRVGVTAVPKLLFFFSLSPQVLRGSLQLLLLQRRPLQEQGLLLLLQHLNQEGEGEGWEERRRKEEKRTENEGRRSPYLFGKKA